MAIEVNEIQPQAVVNSPHHQNLADGVEQLFQGAWNWIQAHLPEHETAKPNTLNNIVAAYDNAIAAIRSDADATASKLADEAKADAAQAEQTIVGGAESAAGDVLSGVAAAEGSTPTDAAATPSPASTPEQTSAPETGDGTSTPTS